MKNKLEKESEKGIRWKVISLERIENGLGHTKIGDRKILYGQPPKKIMKNDTNTSKN